MQVMSTGLVVKIKSTIASFLIYIYRLTFFIPKKKNLILFGSMNGKRYGDNSRHLFEWVLKNKPNINAVWVTNSNEIKIMLENRNLPVVKSLSVKGFLTFSRAALACYTNSFLDITFDYRAVPSSLKLIALRHGRGIKGVRFARQNHKIPEPEKIQRLKESKLILKSIACSEFQADIQEMCLLIGREKHKVTGYPRNDWVLKNADKRDTIWSSNFENNVPSFSILYAPTWRHGREPTKFFPFSDFDKTEFIELLESIDGVLLLRPHVNDLAYHELREFLDFLCKDNDRIRFCTHNEVIDVNTILPAIDLLVTDWCSIEHDYILLNRPILYIPYDYHDFKKNNGFLYDYYDNLSGPTVDSFKNFAEWIIKFYENRKLYSLERNRLLNKIHYYHDAKSCERVYDFILSEIVE